MYGYTVLLPAISARSAVYATNNSGPTTDPCGTEQTMYTVNDVELLNITRNILPDRYDRNHASTVGKPNFFFTGRYAANTVEEMALNRNRPIIYGN